jgi:hypothetical protein
MNNFRDADYEAIIADILHDAFYIDSSIRGKIGKIRQYAEIFVRRILDYNEGKQLTLGSALKPLEKEDSFVHNAVNIIRCSGNDATHTQHLEQFEESELEKVMDAFFDVISYLFIAYFKKRPISYDTHPQVFQVFSQLPPNIRYKTLNYLFDKDPTNINIIDRLTLAIVKEFGKNQAKQWLESHRLSLEAIPYPDEKQKEIFKAKMAPDLARVAISAIPFANAYNLCLNKIEKVGDYIDEHGTLYKTFEQAKKYYESLQHKDVPDDVRELLDIMDFVYLGRRREE